MIQATQKPTQKVEHKIVVIGCSGWVDSMSLLDIVKMNENNKDNRRACSPRALERVPQKIKNSHRLL